MIQCTLPDGGKASFRHACVDSVVIKDGKILLVKRATRLTEGGKWGLPGGYMDRDETTSQAAEREVLEETGYEVKNIKLLTIRDNPDRTKDNFQNLSFVFLCEAGEKIADPDDESDSQQWFPENELPAKDEMAFDHYKNIQLYLDHKKQNFNLPFLS